MVRAAFHDRSQVDRLAAEIEPWEVHHDQRYIVVDVDRAGWQRLVELGFVPEVDPVRTADMLRPRVRLPGQVAGIPGFPCYRTVEETFASARGHRGRAPDAGLLDRTSATAGRSSRRAACPATT